MVRRGYTVFVDTRLVFHLLGHSSCATGPGDSRNNEAVKADNMIVNLVIRRDGRKGMGGFDPDTQT